MPSRSCSAFLGIGALRSGSTWLHRNLSEHPQIWMPDRKELNYFNCSRQYLASSALSEKSILRRVFSRDDPGCDWRREFRKGVRAAFRKRSLSRFIWELKYLFGSYDDAWYTSLFSEGEGKVCGEISPAYLLLEIGDIQRIQALMPGVKIILLLRNPVERAWSHAQFSFRRRPAGRKPSPDSFYRWHFQSDVSLQRGNYAVALERWRSVFSKEQIHMGFFDELMQNPEGFLEEIYHFLEVEPSFRPQDPERRIEASDPSAREMPIAYRQLLSRLHYPQLCRLSEDLGGWCEVWRETAEEVLQKNPS